jgi:arylsulfatase A
LLDRTSLQYGLYACGWSARAALAHRIAVFSFFLVLLVQAAPNIVLIMADDMGLGDIGLHHRERTGKPPLAPTPTLDALAAEGLWFSDAHSPTALCSPSRYAVMTGNCNYRSYAPWGVWGTFRESPITGEDATLGKAAQAAGYRSGFIGKWHLGGDFMNAKGTAVYRGDDRGEQPLSVDARKWVGGGPQQLGFDYDFTLPTGVQGPVYVAYENGVWHPLAEDSRLINYNKDTAVDPIFVSDKGPGTGDSAWDSRRINTVLAEKASAFIADSAGETPFFLCYWTPAVHIPHTPSATFAGSTPSKHLDMIRVLDWEVAQIVKALKAANVYEDTLMLFTSDNGGLNDSKAGKAGHRSSGGWRGSKNLPYEGGHRVPLIASWPKVIKPGRSDAMVNGTDILATIADLAGATLSETQAMDSWSFAALLRGVRDFEPRRELMLQAGSMNQLIYRQGKWKLIIQTNHRLSKWEPMALFDLAANPMEVEAENMLNHPEHRSRVERMLSRYRELRKSGVRTAGVF